MRGNLTYWIVRELCIMIVALLMGLGLHYSLIWALSYTNLAYTPPAQKQEVPDIRWEQWLREVKRT